MKEEMAEIIKKICHILVQEGLLSVDEQIKAEEQLKAEKLLPREPDRENKDR